jgi:transcriptional regulator with GAF, ATPase, and Fis domain
LRAQDSLYLPPAEVLAAEPPVDRSARAYRALLKIAAALESARGAASLIGELLARVLDILPAEHAALIPLEGGALQPEASVVRSRLAGAPARLDVRRVLAERAAQSLDSILWPGDDATAAVLAAPLIDAGRPAAVLYLQAATRAAFDVDHLQLLTAIATLAGAAIGNARELDRMREENARLQAEAHHGMVGDSQPIRDVRRFITRVGPADAAVLILGETGTGKELVARAVHDASPRAQRPFVAINCASLTETLLESELFGHERGAFTGAVAQKRGKLEMADGGTVFLDEVGELPANLQARLLRVLQLREFERVGGTRTLKVDFRIVAATNRDLNAAIAAGQFRSDLFYRLSVLTVRLPALRDRREDIPLLAQHFLSRIAARGRRRLTGIGEEARACLVNYDWPGNVRELENALEAAAVLGSTELLLPEDLPEAILEAAPVLAVGSFHGTVQHQKRDLILAALKQSGGNVTAAARQLRLHPNYLHRLIRNLGLRDELRKGE